MMERCKETITNPDYIDQARCVNEDGSCYGYSEENYHKAWFRNDKRIKWFVHSKEETK